MKQFAKVMGAMAVLALVVVIASCASKPPKEPSKPVTQVKGPAITVIQHQNTLLGGDIPDWVSKDVSDLEADAKYKDQYLFKEEATGASLTGAKLIATRLNADSEVARLISLRVQNLFSGAQVGDDKAVETYMENIVKSLADAKISGWTKLGEFWVQYEYNDTKKQEYRYYVLYGIGKDQVKQLISDTANQQQAETPDKQTAKDRVKQISQANLPSLTPDQTAADVKQ